MILTTGSHGLGKHVCLIHPSTPTRQGCWNVCPTKVLLHSYSGTEPSENLSNFNSKLTDLAALVQVLDCILPVDAESPWGRQRMINPQNLKMTVLAGERPPHYILKYAQISQRLSVTPPDEVLSVPEDLGLPTDCIAREFHSAQVDQQHRRKLTLTPTSSFFIFHGISQRK